jgi:ribosomal protein S18 acetylase RimI-like enzyme
MKDHIHIRNLALADQEFIWQMLMYASHEQTVEAVKSNINLARYANNWGRQGDIGFIAIDEDGPVGAAWIRLWSDNNKGFGFLSNEIPELVVATRPDYRGKGFGTQLMTTLLSEIKSNYPAVSLSVRRNNLAVNLYKKLNFFEVEGSEIKNRTGGISLIMKKDFNLVWV